VIATAFVVRLTEARLNLDIARRLDRRLQR